MVSIPSGLVMNRLVVTLYNNNKDFIHTGKQENLSVNQRRLIEWY